MIPTWIIILDYKEKEVYAGRIIDTSGKLVQYPFFKQGNLGVNIVLRSTDKSLLLSQHKLIEELVNNLKGQILETHLPNET